MIQEIAAVPTTASSPRLLDRVRQEALAQFGRPEPGERYADWVRRFVLFHEKRHPIDLSREDVGRFLAHLSQAEKDPRGSMEQAREALGFLYETVLKLDRGEIPLPKPPKLLDRLRHAVRVRHLSPRTEECYVMWSERYIRFHGLRHPRDMGGALLGHESLETMIYTHVARKGPAGVASPLDALAEWTADEIDAAAEASRRMRDGMP